MEAPDPPVNQFVFSVGTVLLLCGPTPEIFFFFLFPDKLCGAAHLLSPETLMPVNASVGGHLISLVPNACADLSTLDGH